MSVASFGNPLKIAVLGGVPASLGGGGLELQRDRTIAALRARGHDVFRVEAAETARGFDILHAFGSEVDVSHYVRHWRINTAPLVVSPVIVAAPGKEETVFRASARMPWASLAPRMRTQLLRRAQLLIALTEHEARLLRTIAPAAKVVVVGNGVDLDTELCEPDLEGLGVRRPFALLLGTVSERKRQRETVSQLGSTALQPVVVGGFDGNDQDRQAFVSAVSRAGGRWLGEINNRAIVRGLLRDADALVHLSSAEGQSLAILESIAEGTPVICSPLPANVELAARYPAYISLCNEPRRLGKAITTLPPRSTTVPTVPSWADVAVELEKHYRRLL
jgi:glycosyltransferase involved in cell wall biosynthesis